MKPTAPHSPEVTDFRQYLQQELLERCRANPSYSLRAFARGLKIGPSALSDMLNQKRAITPKMVERLGLNLNLNAQEIFRYQSAARKKRLAGPAAAFETVPAAQFAVISDWYCDALLELMKVDGFRPEAAWAARRLGLTKSEVNIALERLQQVGALVVEEGGNWRDCSSGFTSSLNPQFTSAAARKRQRQYLELSLQALEQVDIDQRNHTGMTIAVDTADMPEVVERIREFRRSLSAFLESRPQSKEVYQLAISYFPLTKTIKKDP